jgi:hypothetical protein
MINTADLPEILKAFSKSLGIERSDNPNPEAAGER